jgi:hypothetical protein
MTEDAHWNVLFLMVSFRTMHCGDPPAQGRIWLWKLKPPSPRQHALPTQTLEVLSLVDREEWEFSLFQVQIRSCVGVPCFYSQDLQALGSEITGSTTPQHPPPFRHPPYLYLPGREDQGCL